MLLLVKLFFAVHIKSRKRPEEAERIADRVALKKTKMLFSFSFLSPSCSAPLAPASWPGIAQTEVAAGKGGKAINCKSAPRWQPSQVEAASCRFFH